MSRKSKREEQRKQFPLVKPAPTAPAEPPDIDESGNMTPAEQALFNKTLGSFGGPGVVVPIVQNVPNNNHAGIHPVYKPEPSPKQVEAIKAAMQTPANTFELGPRKIPHIPNGSPKEIEGVNRINESLQKDAKNRGIDPLHPFGRMNEAGERVFTDQDARLDLAQSFEQMAANAAVGAEPFANLTRPELFRMITYYQQAVTNLLITTANKPPAIGLAVDFVPLFLRGEEDRKNRRALLDLCARLDISAAELTLEMLNQNLQLEAWRLGDAAGTPPVFESNEETRADWERYKEELGLIKRVGR